MNCIKKIANVCILLLMTTGATWGMDIFQAAGIGNIGRIEELLASGADVNQRNNLGETALHYAALTGHTNAIRMLIELRALVNQQDNHGATALHWAAMNGHANAIRMLIQAGCGVNQKDNYGMIPLHYAARYGHADAIRVLIAAGADINQQDHDGITALNNATTFNRHTIVALLNDYIQRMEQARQRVPVIAHILAQATHHRLGADSPLALLPQELMRHITHLVAEAEAVDARRPRQAVQEEEVEARRPRQSSDSRSWCIIS